jgi:hypothetical protein
MGAQLVATTMIVVGTLPVHAGELPGLALTIVGMLLVLDLDGVLGAVAPAGRVARLGARQERRGRAR